MITRTGTHIMLRALEPSDVDFLFHIENDERLWHLSETQTPFSRHILENYLSQSHQDIYTAKQLRLAICKIGAMQPPIGFIDLFDFNPMHHRAGVGIVLSESQRGKGYGKEALSLLMTYASGVLQLHQLYANIGKDNKASIGLFTEVGFEQVGVKKDWQYTRQGYQDELLFQVIL